MSMRDDMHPIVWPEARRASWEGFLVDLGSVSPTAADETRARAWPAEDRLLPWWVLRALLAGEPVPPCARLARVIELRGEMVAAESVKRLVASGLCMGLEGLMVYGTLQTPDSLWALLDALTELQWLDLRSPSPMLGSAPPVAARPSALHLGNCNTRWPTALTASSLFERVQRLKLVRLQGVSKGMWPSRSRG
ncbi:MAG TPA: hypothetical protein VNM90_15695 [Haliangium sp.]|nr:hypothetical protein [Haliangium sp.]